MRGTVSIMASPSILAMPRVLTHVPSTRMRMKSPFSSPTSPLPAAGSASGRPATLRGYGGTSLGRGGMSCCRLRLGRGLRRVRTRSRRLGCCRAPRRRLRLRRLAGHRRRMSRRPMANGRLRCVMFMIPMPDMPWWWRRRRGRDIDNSGLDGERRIIAGRIAFRVDRRGDIAARVAGVVGGEVSVADATRGQKPKRRKGERCKCLVVVHGALPSCRIADI